MTVGVALPVVDGTAVEMAVVVAVEVAILPYTRKFLHC